MESDLVRTRGTKYVRFMTGIFAAIMALALFSMPSAQATPPATPDDVEASFETAEAANEAVNQARADQAASQARIDQINAEIATAQAAYDQQREALAGMIVDQQTTQPLGATVGLMNSSNTAAFLDGLTTVETVNSNRAQALEDFQAAQDELNNRREKLSEEQAVLAEATRVAEEKQAEVQASYQQAQAQLAQLSAADQSTFNTSNTQVDSATAQALASGSGGGSAAAQAAVSFALAQLGDPYVYGGTGPNGWDCSGLVQGAYASAGVYLPRVVGPQMASGRRISASELQPGDLVAYSDMSHIGIYIGNGQVVHAPRPGRSVEITGLGRFSVFARVA